MDIEKLIEQLKYYGTTYAIGDSLGREIEGSDELMLNAAIFLSTLQAENAKLRAELEQVKHQLDSYRAYYDDMASKPNCNTCADKDCKYRPIPGDTVRANCPLWRGAGEG